ncbi:MAG: pseudouridine synthase [Proteobacteria bacterium]|nr:pseudouridine synthase [Pseudomonadota bacterium]
MTDKHHRHPHSHDGHAKHGKLAQDNAAHDKSAQDKTASDNARGRLSLHRGESAAAAPRLEERLHKVLAQAGLGSRRALEERIAHGMVRVNGEVAQVGSSIGSGDRVELDGRSFVASALNEPARVLIYNKPEGEVTTREDPEGRPTIFEALPNIKGARWIAVGRLDINTTGLLLLTTDGELANALMHPSREVEREYVCRIHGEVPDNIVDRLKRGVALDDGPAKFDLIEPINSSDAHAWFRVGVKEGRNREVRRLWESQGYQVSRLKRIRYGAITLPRLLKRGQSEELPQEQVEALQKELGLEGGAQVLTLQPVIGQRKARNEIHIRKEERGGKAYVNGALSTADEGRELRRFDHVREDRPGRGPRKHGGYGKKNAHGNAPPKQHHHGRHEDQPPASYSHDKPAHGRGAPRGRPYGQHAGNGHPGGARHGDKPFGQGRPFKPRPGQGGPAQGGNSTEFRSWYVPEGVDTGPRQARGGHHRGQGRPGTAGQAPYAPSRGGPRGQGAPRPHGGHPGTRDPQGFHARSGDGPRGERGRYGGDQRPDHRGDHRGEPRNDFRGERTHAGPSRGPQGPRRDGQRPPQRGPGGTHKGPRGDRPHRPGAPRYEGLPRDED